MRIVVLGCGGSGKSWLTRQLSSALDLPAYHLDVLDAGQPWSRQPTELQLRQQRALVSGQRWVIDGNHVGSLPIRLARADTVVLIDLPTRTALLSLVRRILQPHGQRRPRPRYLWYVAGYRSRVRPQILHAVAEHAPHARLLHVRSRADAAALPLVLSQGGTEGGVDGQASGRRDPRAADPWRQQHDASRDAGPAHRSRGAGRR